MSHPPGGLRRLQSLPWAAEALALLAGGVYFIQSVVYAHTRESILDEGAYLLKGLLFATHQYTPYQDYGPWTNHTPLAFLIPGYVQLWFGPGLRTGRYLAIGVGLLMLLGLWLVCRRLGGRWWAAAALWVIAANPAVIKMYSVFLTQGLIACMLVWTLALALGPGRKTWQVALGAVLAGLAMMTRINLAPALPLLVLYTFWQHGRKAGLAAAAAGGAVVILGHAWYWPGILRLWAYWIPAGLAPFLATWRMPEATLVWSPEVGLAGRLASFFAAFRVSFTALVGALAAWLLWPRRQGWKDQSALRSAVFLSALFLILLGFHTWASLGKDYCVYCLPGYTTFFAVSGLILVVVSAPAWQRRLPAWRQLGILLLILLISAGIGYSTYEDYGAQLYHLPFPRLLLGYPPGSGSVEVGELLRTLFGFETGLVRRLLPTLAGLSTGLAFLLLGAAMYWLYRRRQAAGLPSFGAWSLSAFLLLGSLLAPAAPLAGGYPFLECGGDTIASYEAAGAHLARLIPPGSQVFWRGGLSVAPLLYIPGIKIYPAQINGAYSQRRDGEPDELVRFGLWSDEVARGWVGEADIILIQDRFMQGWLLDAARSASFEELEPTPPTVSCRSDAVIHIFRRKP